MVFIGLLTGLSKAFHNLSHELLAAKLIASGFEIFSVRLMHDYLTKGHLRTKTGNKNNS